MRTCGCSGNQGDEEVAGRSGFRAGMWLEILPSFAVMYTALLIPGLSTTFFDKLANNGKEKRRIRTRYNWLLLQREKRVLGNKEMKTIDLEP